MSVKVTPTRAWGALVALSLASTLVAWSGGQGIGAAVVILALGGVKARVILDDYLGLRHVPGWRRGFAAGLVVYLLALVGLTLLA